MPRRSQTRSFNRKSRRRTRSNHKLKGGGGVLPIEYFGGSSDAYVDQCGPVPFSTAYGNAVPHSFGTLGTSLGPSFAGPQLASGGGVSGARPTGIQTGGGANVHKRNHIKGGSRTGKRRRRCRRFSSGTRSTARRTYRRLRGGGAMPSEYYGKTSNAYVDSCGPVSCASAYGNTVPRSFGTLGTSLGPDVAAPQLAPSNCWMGVNAPTGIQTGGGTTYRRRQRRRQRRRH